MTGGNMLVGHDDDDGDDNLPKNVVLMTISTPPSEQHGQQVLTTLSVRPISRSFFLGNLFVTTHRQILRLGKSRFLCS